ncbi:MAG: ECF-type sigma factor [Bryobacteraceae bacterium]
MDGEITALLDRWRTGDDAALNELLPRVYSELHRMAASHLNRQGSGHTLQPTALIHEAYIRLATREQPSWNDRTHFFAVAASIMRQVLVDHARKKRAQKRDCGPVVALDEGTAARVGERFLSLLTIHTAIESLERLDPRKARILDLRVFGGLDLKETAEAMGVSVPTIVRESRLANAWLARALADAGPAN